MSDLPPPLGALRFEHVVRERRRRNGEKQSQIIDRRAVCSREVAPGSLLLPALLPFEAVLAEGPAGLLERCSGTFLPVSSDEAGEASKPRPLMRCSRCKVARYSSAAAQQREWKGSGGGVGLHWRECAALRAFAEASSSNGKSGSSKIPPASIRLAARVFWKRAALLKEGGGEDGGDGGEGDQKRWWSSPGAVAALRHHFSELPDDRQVAVAAAAAATRSFMFGALTEDEKRRAQAEAEAEAEAGEEEGEGRAGGSSPSPTLSQLLLPPPRRLAELLAMLACNAHALSDASQGTLSSYGVGIFPAAAMLNNHSCWPSAAVVFPRGGGGKSRSGNGGDDDDDDGRRLEARALRRLAEGEEATISYVDLCCPRPERRRALLEGYGFDIDDDDDSDDGGKEEVEGDSPIIARWHGRVSFPPAGSSKTTYAVSAVLHEARPRVATERGEEARARRAPLEGVCLSRGDGGASAAAEGSGGIAWIEEEEEEEETEQAEDESRKSGNNRRRKTVRVLAWGRSAFFPDGDDDDAEASAAARAALSFYATTSASAALAAALSSEALAAKDSAEALSLARAGREALLEAENNHPRLPSPSPASYAASRLDDAITHAAVSRGDLGCALDAARRAVTALYLPCSPRGHPPRAFAVATLAKLEAAALGNGNGGGFGTSIGGGGESAAAERVRRAAGLAQQVAEEIGVCFPGSEREAEFRAMAEGLRAEAEARRWG